MRIVAGIFAFCGLILAFISCNYVTYTPRSKKNIHREQPSVVLLSRIVDYRLEQNTWPFSKEDFISKGRIYFEAFDRFPYATTRFKIIDHNNMIFYFSDHIKDLRKYNKTGKADLNSYSGSVKFYKSKDKFMWKLKMN